jgi:16S rRNA (cytidine1402-2'-O)-methyltransferase
MPVTIGGQINSSIPAGNLGILESTDYYIVENLKSAFGFLKQAGVKKPFKDIRFFEYSKKRKEVNLYDYLRPAVEGNDMILMSESGVPCIADPGEDITALAHELGIRIIPLVGPSSILLALMASGMNAESFAFNGYLPIGKNPLTKKIKELEKKIFTDNQTQIFIEAPQRNDRLVGELLTICSPAVRLCIAKNITMDDEHIETKSIESWKKTKILLGKNPVIMILGK